MKCEVDDDTKIEHMIEKKYTKLDGDFIREIISHYKKNGRHDLVWRKHITPYRILVSEIMLQQTQVTRVVPKFRQWMKIYPSLATLRKAPLKDILILWQGLGYQRRAKALYSISQTVTQLPKSFDELLALPGVGVYTASAISSFAYDIFAHPVLETNIRTALINTYHVNEESVEDSILYEDLSRLENNKKIKAIGAREFYYALMDFGAHLKQKNISHNTKSKGYTKQKPYKGSLRELRAKVLFSIAQGERLPTDVRTEAVLDILSKENFITKNKGSKPAYSIL